jgi:predicted transcriptional regulator
MSVTITVSDAIYQELSSLRRREDESDEEIIQDLLYHMIDDEPLSEESLKAIEEGWKDYKEGRCRTLEEVMKDLGIDE